MFMKVLTMDEVSSHSQQHWQAAYAATQEGDRLDLIETHFLGELRGRLKFAFRAAAREHRFVAAAWLCRGLFLRPGVIWITATIPQATLS